MTQREFELIADNQNLKLALRKANRRIRELTLELIKPGGINEDL